MNFLAEEGSVAVFVCCNTNQKILGLESYIAIEEMNLYVVGWQSSCLNNTLNTVSILFYYRWCAGVPTAWQ